MVEQMVNTLGSRVGFYSATYTAAMTLVAFAAALTAVPISGAFCLSDCIEYPFLATAAQHPGDFLWMIPAMLAVLGFVVLMACLHVTTRHSEQVFSQIALSFALIAATVLLANYYLQLSVVPVGLMNSETESLPILIQYNPRGVFIALEELGYLVMSISFLFAGAAITGKKRLESSARRIFIIAFVLVVASLVTLSSVYGLDKLDRFEVVVISVDWLVLMVNGILLGLMFRRQLRSAPAQST
jgi:hypothetical protein